MIDLAMLGMNILRERERKGWSQDKLAEELIVSRQAVSAWELGKSAPTIDNVIELSRLFGLSFKSLLGLGERPVFDDDDMYKGHDRSFVVRSIVNGSYHPDLRKALAQSTMGERALLLKAVREGKISHDRNDLLPELNNAERSLLEGGKDK